jgi:hypothetical protein
MLDKRIENYANMPHLEGKGFKDRNFGGFPQDNEVPKTIFGRG